MLFAGLLSLATAALAGGSAGGAGGGGGGCQCRLPPFARRHQLS
eukprot:COSAG06_NODE_12454_length_1379_cov_2.244531_3_plen_43_part_01